MVVAEAAIAIPALVAVAVLLAWVVSLGITALTLGDAARQVARDVARGVDAATAIDAVRGRAPAARIGVSGSDVVRVTADQEVTAPVLTAISVTVHQEVAMPREPA